MLTCTPEASSGIIVDRERYLHDLHHGVDVSKLQLYAAKGGSACDEENAPLHWIQEEHLHYLECHRDGCVCPDAQRHETLWYVCEYVFIGVF